MHACMYLWPQVASVSNSTLVTQYITSPIVARSMMKDPSHRNLVMRADQTATAKKHIGTVFKTAAMIKGVDVTGLQV